MREMTTRVYSADPRQATSTLEAFTRNLKGVRSQSSPALAVVNNFDPDQRGFVTDALKGYTMVQQKIGVATTGRLAVHADYNQIPPGQTEPMRPQPGQPTLIYPVGSGSGSGNLAFIKGGKSDYKQVYQAKLLTHNIRNFFFGGDGPRISQNVFGETGGTVYTRADTITDFLYGMDILTGGLAEWSENSPLPPGMRYMELERMAANKFGVMGAGLTIGIILARTGLSLADTRLLNLTFPGDVYFTDFDSYLPHDTLGRIRTNRVPAPLNSFYHLDEMLNDDSYWTGEVQTDPLTWKDDYWDGLDRDPTGNSPRVDRAAMKTWLTAHPAARFNP